MDNQEIEKKLQESADKIEMRDFEEVWREIGPKIEAEQAKRRRRKKIFIPVAASLLSVAVACSIILPIALNGNNSNEEIFYLDENLERILVQENEFSTYVKQAAFELIELSQLEGSNYYIFQTEDGKTVGGSLDLLGTVADSVCYIILTFYVKNVQVSEDLNIEYDLSYTTESGAAVEYKLKEATTYYVKAEYQSVQYYMEYTGAGGEVTQFFEEFFR